MLEAMEEKGCDMSVAMAHDLPTSEPEVLLDGFLTLETPEGFRAELIEGEIVVSPPPGGIHEHDLSRLVRQVIQHSATEMDVSGHKGLQLERGGLCPRNYAIPDTVVAPLSLNLFEGAESWMPSDGVALVVEVTSSRPDRDRVDKRHCYAKAEIPLYLLVDREQRTVTLFSEPCSDKGQEDYRDETRVTFGKSLDLPEPFAFSLETADLN